MLLTIFVIFSILVVYVMAYALCSMSAPQTKQEQQLNDDEQIDYLRNEGR